MFGCQFDDRIRRQFVEERFDRLSVQNAVGAD